MDRNRNEIIPHRTHKQYERMGEVEEQEEEEEILEYSTTYRSFKFLPIRGLCGYAIMEIEDDRGIPKVRLAKCKWNGVRQFTSNEYYKWIELDLDHIVNGDLVQVEKIHFEKREDVLLCFEELLKIFR